MDSGPSTGSVTFSNYQRPSMTTFMNLKENFYSNKSGTQI